MAKKKGTTAPDDLDRDQQQRLWDWNVSQRGFGLSKPELRRLVDACLDHHGSKGTEFVDWVRACQTWIRREVEDYGPQRGRHYKRSVWPEARSARSPELPRESGVPADAPLQEELVAVNLDNVVSLVGRKR